MNARMRLLFFTNGLLRKAAGAAFAWSFRVDDKAARRLHVLEQMRKDGRT